MNKVKKLALQIIFLAMEDIKEQMSGTGYEDDLLKLSEIMKNLAESFEKVKRS